MLNDKILSINLILVSIPIYIEKLPYFVLISNIEFLFHIISNGSHFIMLVGNAKKGIHYMHKKRCSGALALE